MILRKKVTDNGVVFEPISFEDAKLVNKSELVFTDEDEKDRFDDLDEDDDNSFSLSKIMDTVSSATEKINKVFGNKNPKSKSNKIIAMLPFMDDDDIHEIVEEILNNAPEYKDLNLAAVMPFLSDEDADSLFIKAIENDYDKVDPSSLAPFVSDECLDSFVDKYITGSYQDVTVDNLYPFMSSKSIKKLFKYYLSKKEE